jgi:hypothetical protein
MLYLAVKALVSGVIIAIASEIAKRSPDLGALILSLPLISILAFIWLWRDTGDHEGIAALAQSTFWFVLPTLPMFLVLPALLRGGHGLLGRARAVLPDDHGALRRHSVGARQIRHLTLSRLSRGRGRGTGLRLGVVLLRQRHVGAPVLSPTALRPCIAFPDQHAGCVFAVDEQADEQPAIFVALGRRVGKKLMAPDSSRASSRCLVSSPKRRSASH